MTSEKMERRGGDFTVHAAVLFDARRWKSAFGAAACGIAVATFGCGSSNTEAGDTKVAAGVRSEVIQHEPCDAGGKQTVAFDTNNDGKPDIQRVMNGSNEVCRITDLDHDGRPDMYEYFDAAGQIRRRESDYDGDGVANLIEYYEAGKLARREIDAASRGRLDTWDFFDPATGKLAKRERDATGSGRVDQWWTYDASGVTVARDRDGDGLPDPHATLTFDRSGAAVTNTSAASAAPEGDAGAPAAPPAPEAPVTPDAGATSTAPADAGATP